ncbi:MAG: hypothetical protein ACTHJR_18915 [Sphingomonas sp.]|uniref:hypothetical protein n=1 Tax=Sphingomonas sp. TaxID=28214 RepID=UPI003F7DD77D
MAPTAPPPSSAAAPSAGYSGTPLAKKLNLASGIRAWFHAMPESVRAEIDPAAIGLILVDTPEPGIEAAHIFVTERVELERLIDELRASIAPAGQIWVSWPKKASKMPTDITEDSIREVALPTGLVDIKVCAIDAIWSGLKLVIRRDLRG